MNQGQVIKYNIVRLAERNPDFLRKNGTVEMRKVAKACDMSPQNFSGLMIKLDEGGVTLNTLSKIAKGLRCDVIDLLQVKMFNEVKNENSTNNSTPNKL